MSALDLGKYASDYSGIFPVKKNYEAKMIHEDSPIKMFEAQKNKERVFLKVIDKKALEQEDDYDFLIKQIEKEKEISKLVNSKHTIILNKEFETENNIIMEKEYCESDLKEVLFQNGPFENKMIGKNNLQIFKDIVIDLAKALKYLNEKGVVHRDIKPHNIYIKDLNQGKKITKLGNFGSAIYIKDIKNSLSMGTIFYTAPEIVKNLNYDEKCDLWSVGMTLFEIYFGILPYGWNPNTNIMNEMIYDEEKFVYKKSEIPTLDILFRRLLQINPANRMSVSEFYDYVTNENFLNGDFIAINNNEIYLKLHEEIKSQEQIDYGDGRKPEKLNKEDIDKQNIGKIMDFVGEENLPDIMSFPNGSFNDEKIFNNIIYYDTNIEKHKKEIHKDSNKIERKTNGAFILCSNLVSLNIIKNEILRNIEHDKKAIFNFICNGKGYETDIKKFLTENKEFKKCLNKLCIYCQHPQNYMKYMKENPEFIFNVTSKSKDIYDFIIKFSSMDIKPFPLTKLVTLDDYLNKYKERHKKISEYYGDLTKESFEENMKKMKENIEYDNKENLLKAKKKKNLLKGLMTFNLEKDLESLDELIIKEYTKNTFYGDLNRWLMKGKMKYYEPVAYFTSRLMYSLNKYANEYKKYCEENKKILLRGAKLYYSCLLPYERALGKIILLSAFTSTSEKEEIAKKWAGRGKEEEVYKNSLKFSVVFHITNLYDKDNKWISNSVDVQGCSRFKKEKEFLFQPFSFYRVKNVEFDIDNFKADIYLETVGKKEILEEKIKLGKEIKYNKNENIMDVS